MTGLEHGQDQDWYESQRILANIPEEITLDIPNMALSAKLVEFLK